ncbi:hypothetical protein AAF712_009061 [Marasmius tenuissimus]|uniref:GST N-terminal domain-containing protein n=1 Tax=Marasmius tenuissimus TaxID=585030 RepID=A0ABR2ZTA2_9AGAR|nr:hypothetical protein PM082_002027 [Marasmius tenuissimus]
MITLYDMGPTACPTDLGASPHTRKIIFTLNYKKLPFEIKPIAPDDIEATAKAVGAPHTSILANGKPRYTIPFIQDHNTGKAVSDSFRIAEYLDEAYPDTPKVIPDGTRALQLVFIDALTPKFMLLIPVVFPKFEELYPGFIAGRRKVYGGGPDSPYPDFPQLTEEQKKGMWVQAKASFGQLEAAYGEEKLWVMGGKPVFADFALSVFFVTLMVACGEESEEWKDVSGWAGGRIGRLVEETLKYRSPAV